MTVALPSISVVIPTYNRSDVVARTLRHLLDQDFPPEHYEIIVVDNSADDTPAVVTQIGAASTVPVQLICNDERLPAVKRNQGLAAARHDLVLFMNDDVWVGPGFLTAHARAHVRHREPVAVLGHVRQSPEMEQTPFISSYQPFAYHLVPDGVETLPYWFSWSMNLSLPRAEMLERNLVFHEDWREIGHEDVELGYRWCHAGRKLVYDVQATGDHFHPHTVASACRLQHAIGRGLRDLESLVPDPVLLERYGVLSLRNSHRSIIRGVVRSALFNRVTTPPLVRWLDSRRRDTAVNRWLYWKVLLHHTNRGYRSAAPRRPTPLVTRRPGDTEGEAA